MRPISVVSLLEKTHGQVSSRISTSVWMAARSELRDKLQNLELGTWSGSRLKRQLGAPPDSIDYYVAGCGLVRFDGLDGFSAWTLNQPGLSSEVPVTRKPQEEIDS